MRTFVLASLACVLVGCDGGQIATTTPDSNMLGLQAKATGELAAPSAPLPDTVSFDGAVNAIQRAPDGTIYLGGAFTRVGAVTGSAVPIDAMTGNLVPGTLPRFVGQATAVAADGAGGWYVGGTFTVQAGGAQLTNLAHVLANNTIDVSFRPNPNNAVLALAVSGTAVYAAGRFTVIGGAARNRLVAFNKSSGALLSWNPDVNGSVNTVRVSGTTVYAGGAFATVGVNTRNNLAAFNAADAATNPGMLLPWDPSANGVVAALDIAGGTVYVGGSFTTIGGATRRCLAAIGASGTGKASTWNPDPNGAVTALAVTSSGATPTVYFSGSFGTVTDADGTSRVRQHLAAVTASGSVTSWDPAPNNPALALRILGSTVYLGGTFTALRGQMRYRLAAIGTDGALRAWNPSAHDQVNALAVAGAGNSAVVYAGGLFPSVGGAARNFLAAVDASGALLPWNPNANSIVQSLAVSGTTIYAAGQFTQVGGLNRSRLAAIGADGVVSPTWAPAVNSLVYAIVVSGNTLYAGGQFTAVNATVRNRLAAVDANPAGAGQLFPQWDPNVADGAVYALTLADGVLYAGGNFTGVGGFTRNRLASVSADPNVAATVSNWNPNVAGGDVLALASADGVVYAGGSFSTVGGLPRKFLAALDVSGNGQVLDWAPNPNTYVTSLALSGGVVYVGGAFTRINNVVRNALAAVGTSGRLLAFDPNANGVANALAVSGNTVYAGGLFSSLAGTPHGHIGFIPALPTFTVGGTLAGLDGGSVTLQNNGTNRLKLSGNGTFTFTAPIAAGDTYNVAVRSQPEMPPQVCAVTNGSGTIAGNVTNVAVGCSDARLQAIPGVHSSTLSWAAPPSATRFNLFVSSERNCDIANYASCRDGALLPDVQSPRTVAALRNGRTYFFRLETIFSNGARTLSTEAGARPNVLVFTNQAPTSDIRAMTTGADGTIYLGGSFTSAGVMTGSFVPLDNVAGQALPSDFPIVAGDVAAFAPDGAGGWYIGGTFEQVGAVRRRNLAHVLADGTVAANFNPEPNGPVFALAHLRDTLYVAGQFTSIANVSRQTLAALDVNGTAASWAPQTAGLVHALAAAGNTVYAGGTLTAPQSSLAAFNAADAPAPGALVPWAQVFAASNHPHPFIRALTVAGDVVYIGGQFEFINSAERHNLGAAKTVEASQSSDPVLPWRADTTGNVYAIAIAPNRIYIGGAFGKVAGSFRDEVAAFTGLDDATPGQLLPWRPVVSNPLNGGVGVTALAAVPGKVYIGGHVTLVSGEPRGYLAAVADDLLGTLLPWNPNLDSMVAQLAVVGDTVVAAGTFASVASVQRNHLAAVDADGALLPWNPDANANVLSMDRLRDMIYFGGNFSKVNGELRNGLAAVSTDGTLSSTFPQGLSGESARSFNSITISRHPAASAQLDRIYGSDLLAIAGFYPADASVTPGARLNWNPVFTGGFVDTVTWMNNGLFVGGDFKTMEGTTRYGLAQFNDVVNPDHPDLLAWEIRAHNPPSPFSRVTLLASGLGSVYAAGPFTQLEDFFNGVKSRAGFGVFAGSVVQDWVAQPGLSSNPNLPLPSVHAITRSGNDIYVGGSFTQVGPDARFGLAKFSPDGTPDPDWRPSVSDVGAIAVGNGKVYVGGPFVVAGEQTRYGFAIVNADGSIAE